MRLTPTDKRLIEEAVDCTYQDVWHRFDSDESLGITTDDKAIIATLASDAVRDKLTELLSVDD